MSGPTPAQILEAAGVPFSSFTHAPIRTYEDIERELRLPAEQLLKTLAFRTDDGFVLVSMPMLLPAGYGKIAKAAGVSRSKLRRAGEDDLTVLGMAPGGISPLTELADKTVVFHATVPSMGKVYCGSGRDDETIEVDAASLVDLVRPVIADVAS
ncbi:Cys-tRNA(Pro)/Cys-tRNA(Cys) deacylase [Saccharothrix tamanrassetensis]|uniref:Cys-tRNA(Pro)/Cys-tRNA(Cys) deacylase n=1 Tax=Saccharothrix tamanrassetensis TaxID=1051531 RepID=A0A841CPD3_9PSEU|nr:YbaK/EbsC family protein [Saccharothrix tamanrassetensis]MBB5959521.1 Cys-tRNA(Pro)/Cys-tRNA(Cys) deacylase [Saccharothrix tamanrassetensis]